MGAVSETWLLDMAALLAVITMEQVNTRIISVWAHATFRLLSLKLIN